MVLYRSVSPRGKAIAVSGVVSVPKGRPPRGGWPVVSWAHGQTGMADRCAPSKDSRISPAHDGIAYAYPLLNRLLREGYAVVRTDYEGLGTPGPNPNFVGVSLGRGVIDMVRAARQVDRRIGRRWVAAGRSLGGRATLFAAAQGQKWAPELRLRGAVSMAPGGDDSPLVASASLLSEPSPLSRLGALVVGSLRSQGVDLERYLTPKALALVPRIERDCFAQLDDADSWGSIAPGDILRDDVDPRPVIDFTAAQDPGRLRLQVPTEVQTGANDADASPAASQATADALRARFRSYPATDHREVLAAGRRDLERFLDRRLR